MTQYPLAIFAMENQDFWSVNGVVNPTINHYIKSSNVNGPDSMTLKNWCYNPDFSWFLPPVLLGFIPMRELLKAQWLGIVLLIGMMYNSGSFMVDSWKWALIVAPTLRMNEKNIKHEQWGSSYQSVYVSVPRQNTWYKGTIQVSIGQLGVVNGEGYPLVN